MFAKHLKKLLFENNSEIADYPFVTSEVYILLLFEIARRRVKNLPDPTFLKKELHAVKIDEAITNLIDLMETSCCKDGKNFIALVTQFQKEKMQLTRLKENIERLYVLKEKRRKTRRPMNWIRKD